MQNKIPTPISITYSTAKRVFFMTVSLCDYACDCTEHYRNAFCFGLYDFGDELNTGEQHVTEMDRAVVIARDDADDEENQDDNDNCGGESRHIVTSLV